MKAANGMPGYPDNLKTKRQWADIGYLPKDKIEKKSCKIKSLQKRPVPAMPDWSFLHLNN